MKKVKFFMNVPFEAIVPDNMSVDEFVEAVHAGDIDCKETDCGYVDLSQEIVMYNREYILTDITPKRNELAKIIITNEGDVEGSVIMHSYFEEFYGEERRLSKFSNALQEHISTGGSYEGEDVALLLKEHDWSGMRFLLKGYEIETEEDK